MAFRESFSIPYGGAELRVSCLDSLKNEDSIIRERILKDEKQICRT